TRFSRLGGYLVYPENPVILSTTYSAFQIAGCRARRRSASRFARAGPLREIHSACVAARSQRSRERSTPEVSRYHFALTLRSTRRASHGQFPALSRFHSHTQSLPQHCDTRLASIPG